MPPGWMDGWCKHTVRWHTAMPDCCHRCRQSSRRFPDLPHAVAHQHQKQTHSVTTQFAGLALSLLLIQQFTFWLLQPLKMTSQDCQHLGYRHGQEKGHQPGQGLLVRLSALPYQSCALQPAAVAALPLALPRCLAPVEARPSE